MDVLVEVEFVDSIDYIFADLIVFIPKSQAQLKGLYVYSLSSHIDKTELWVRAVMWFGWVPRFISGKSRLESIIESQLTLKVLVLEMSDSWYRV